MTQPSPEPELVPALEPSDLAPPAPAPAALTPPAAPVRAPVVGLGSAPGAVRDRIAVFASGRGSNLAALTRAFPGQVVLVVSDHPDAPALERAQAAGIDGVHVHWPAAKTGRRSFEAAAQDLLAARGVSLVLLAGFMRLLSERFTAAWRGRLLNIHPSLLPDFAGLHAQRQALAAGAAHTGCTVHFVDAGMDTGEPILQKRVPILPGDTEDTLSARLLPAEHEAYPQAVRLLQLGLAFPPLNESELRAEFGVSGHMPARTVRAARLLRAWGQPQLVPVLLGGLQHPLPDLARATDDLRLGWTALTPLRERQARWAARGALLARAEHHGVRAEVEEALIETAAEWERTAY